MSAEAPVAAARRGPSVVVRARRLLRSPRLIITELLAVALSGVLMTVVPQAADRDATMRFAQAWPTTASVARALALDRVVHSAWFLVLVLLATASLVNVLVELWRRAFREYGEALGEASFRSAPFQRVLERRPRGEATTFKSTGRAGVFGPGVFHVGLLLVVLAGAGRALFAAEAVVELAEGETLPAEPSAFFYEAHGLFASPFHLSVPVRLERIDPQHYPSGELKGLSAVVSTGGAGAGMTWRPRDVGINAPLELGVDRLYLLMAHGPAALLTVRGPAGADSVLVMLRRDGEVFEAASLHGTLVLRLRGWLTPEGRPAEKIELRALREGALLFVGTLAPGEAARLPSGEVLELAGVRTWASFEGARDVSQWLAYLGFVAALVGAFLMFLVVKVDTAVVVTATETGERVLVALKAHRSAPVYAERFERLVAEQSDR